MTQTLTLATVPDDELLRRLSELLCDSRRTEVDLVAHVGEVDGRRLYARFASPSMFVYCTRVLHLSGAEAYLRITAARAAREHPVLLEMLSDGRLHLSGVARLAPHLTRENRDAILRRAVHRSKRQIDELIAELHPRPDVPALVRKLPDRGRAQEHRPLAVALGGSAGARDAGPSGAADPELTMAATAVSVHVGTVEQAEAALPVSQRMTTAASVRPRADRAHAVPSGAGPDTPAGTQLRPDGVGPRSVVVPLAPSRYKVQFTASADLRDKLERLQALLSTQLPCGDLDAVIELAVSETLARLEARRFGTRRTSQLEATRGAARLPPSALHSALPSALPAALPAARAGLPNGARSQSSGAVPDARRSRHIPAAIRRAVYERDGGRCRYVDESGRRCPERNRLEYHHLHPFGMGGGHALENVRLLCPAHNLHAAERDYGRRAMDQYRRPIQHGGTADPERRAPQRAGAPALQPCGSGARARGTSWQEVGE